MRVLLLMTFLNLDLWLLLLAPTTISSRVWEEQLSWIAAHSY